jgi:hypothetical protein
MGQERRNIKNRAAIVQRVIHRIVQNPNVTLTVHTMQQWLAYRGRLPNGYFIGSPRPASSGFVKEVQTGTWVRGSLALARWY